MPVALEGDAMNEVLGNLEALQRGVEAGEFDAVAAMSPENAPLHLRCIALVLTDHKGPAASELNHTTASAISSGLPNRPSGWRATACCSNPSNRSKRGWVNGVRMYPGHTALTRMPDSAYSSVAALVSPATPCLLAI